MFPQLSIRRTLALCASTLSFLLSIACAGQTQDKKPTTAIPGSASPHYASRSAYEHDEYILPQSTCGPWAIAIGPDHALWFTETRVCHGIGRIDLNGKITEFPINDMNMGRSDSIVLGPDKALWFAAGNKIGRITTSGLISSYATPMELFDVTALAVGPDKAIWFAGFADDGSTKAIGRIDDRGHARFVMQVPAIPWGITTGADGAIWFTLDYPPAIGRLTMNGKYRRFPVDASPEGITATSDGKIWFTERHDNAIGWIDSSGKTASFPIPAGDVNPDPIVPGPGGVWYGSVSLLGRVGADQTITTFWPKSPGAGPMGIAIGPGGAIWFTQFYTNAIGRIKLKQPFSSSSLMVMMRTRGPWSR